MILPYLIRLLCLSLGCFFLVHLALASGMSLLASAVLKLANRLKPSSAAGLLLAARLFPSVAAVMVVAGICVPSYLWLEPEETVEQVGLVCLAAALLSVVSWGISIGRGIRALALSIRYGRHCQQVGRETPVAGENTPVLVIEGAAGLLALAGISHSRLIISREVLRQLSPEQLAVALRHERAHWSSRDNLKRLLMLLAPDVFPLRLRFFAGFEALERGWTRFTEWAADDRAVGGDPGRSVSLAGALVRVARLGATAPACPLMTSLVADGRDLEARVERLLGVAPGGEKPARWSFSCIASIVLLAGLLVTVPVGPGTLHAAHRMLEHLIR